MIHLDQFSVFIPHGRVYKESHPSIISKLNGVESSPSDVQILNSKEFWKLEQIDESGLEQEIYVYGCLLIWSQGSGQLKKVIKTFTVNSDIKSVVWSAFNNQLPEQSECMEKSLCVVEEECINVFSGTGAIKSTSLPFQVAHVMAISGGLLLERNIGEATQMKSKKIPTLFSLLDPSDEPRPVVARFGEKTSYFSENTTHVVHSWSDPPMVLTYDSVMAHHSIWILRAAKKEDYPEPTSCTTECPPEFPPAMFFHHRTPILSTGAHSRLSVAPSPTITRHSHVHTPSPSGKMFSRHLHSPYISSPVPRWQSAKAHLQSPSHPSFGDSSFITGLQSPDIFRSPATVAGNSHEETFWDFVEPLVPEICLEHVWEEPSTITLRHTMKGETTKAFVTTDVCGENYICYLLPYIAKLKFVKFIRGERADHFIFGTSFDISAVDAVPVKHLSMVLVLSPDNTLVLYSGKVKGCELNMTCLKESILRNPVDEDLHVSDSSIMDISSEMMVLSPVNEEQPPRKNKYTEDFDTKLKVASLRDPVGCDVIIVLDDGQMRRISLPRLVQDETVSLCLSALKQILPNEIAVKTLFKYYLTRNEHDLRRSNEWQDFAETIFDLSGYEVNGESFSNIPRKKSKTHVNDGEAAWQFLQECDFAENVENFGLCSPSDTLTTEDHSNEDKEGTVWSNITWQDAALLYQYLPTVVFALHLVQEDLQLQRLSWQNAKNVAELLFTLTSGIGWTNYASYYLQNYPEFSEKNIHSDTSDEKQPSKMLFPSFFTHEPPNLYLWLNECLKGRQNIGFPLIPDACEQTYNIIMMYSIIIPRKDGTYNDDPETLFKRLVLGHTSQFEMDSEQYRRCPTAADRMLLFMGQQGFTKDDLGTLSFGVSLPLREAIQFCCGQPSSCLPRASYTLIGREELAAQAKQDEKNFEYSSILKQHTDSEEVDDGMNFDCEVTNLLYSRDLRIQEVKRLLQSAKPVQVSLVQKPEVSDHDFIQEQEARLLLICKRTLSLSVGRGMFTLSTSRPTLTEMIPIPPLDITGRASSRNAVISLDHVDVPTDMLVWPAFHNGVAAGLRIFPGISQIDSTWIVYHRPKDNQLTNEHAGFLMALGLTGHLANLATMNIHNYLCKGHELTSIGLLIGLAATKRGTMDVATTKVLSIHIDALLPPTSAELDVPSSVMSAAILGIGLVYQGTAHRLMTEVLLSEIGRPPGPEMENAYNRECYSLSAGLALGLVMLEHGRETFGVSGINISDHLYHYMVGGQKKPQSGTQKEKFKSPSYLIKEGSNVNTNVTAPGAIVALGLIYLKSNNKTVASWLSAPETPVLAEFIRPDFLLLRILCRGLIMWDHISPTVEWVQSHIPKIVQEYAFKQSDLETSQSGDIDFQTISQTYVNIIAGSCLAMGLKFAGSYNKQAFTTLIHYTKYFKDLVKKPEAEQAGKITLQQCLNTTLLASAVVMAGSGNLEVLRIARDLRKRHGNDVTYGSHMAIHMAIGLLFLGGGRCTLSTSGPAIAALVCSLFPQFPTVSSDNRCHLQALRHLYVLATEPRLIIPRDVDTNVACYVPVEITLKETPFYQETKLKTMAPCMLPDLSLVKQLFVAGQRYWPVVFAEDDLVDRLRTLLSKDGVIFVKKRIGQLPYADDPKGYCNLLARTFTGQTEKVDVIKSFSSDPKIILFTELFCQNLCLQGEEKKKSDFLSSVLLKCVTEETTSIMGIYISIEEAMHSVEKTKDIRLLKELKLMLNYYEHSSGNIHKSNPTWKRLISGEYIGQVKSRLDCHFERCEEHQGIEYPKTIPSELAIENVPFQTLLDSYKDPHMPLRHILGKLRC